MKGFIAALAIVAMVPAAQAAEVVALGASNTAGRGYGQHSAGVDTDQAFPAQLERMLREKGCNVTVLNAGRAGDTTEWMRAREADVIASDTKVLILENPKPNDLIRHVTNNAENVEAIKAFAQSRGVKVVPLGNFASVAGEHAAGDGQHFDAEGHQAMARYLLPAVKAALRCR